jgi:predicted PurR-regulated permease PerM
VLLGIFLHGLAAKIVSDGKIWYRITLLGIVSTFVGLTVWLFVYGVPNFADQFTDLGAALAESGANLRAQIEKYPWLDANLTAS